MSLHHVARESYDVGPVVGKLVDEGRDGERDNECDNDTDDSDDCSVFHIVFPPFKSYKQALHLQKEKAQAETLHPFCALWLSLL